jgi:hypothetical protein
MSSENSIEKDVRPGVAVEPVKDGSTNNGIDGSNPYQNESLAYEDQAVVDNQGRLRRLFSFVQLLAFALTFMSSWEVVAM